MKPCRAHGVNLEDASFPLLHQCLPVDHKTQSGRWWSACQCQTPDKDVSLPLYKSLHPLLLLRREPSALTSGRTAPAKSNLSTAHLHSDHIKCDVVETDNSAGLRESTVEMGPWWEGASCCFHADWGGGNSSLSTVVVFVMLMQSRKYSSLCQRPVIDPLCLLLVFHQPQASIIYCFLSACTWNKRQVKQVVSLIVWPHVEPFVLGACGQAFCN